MHAKFLKLKLPHTLCKTNYLKRSFYYRSIATWNKLPVDIKSTNQSLSSFKKRILDIYTRNTPSDVLSASGVCGVTYVSAYGEGGKGSLRIGGGGFVIYGYKFIIIALYIVRGFRPHDFSVLTSPNRSLVWKPSHFYPGYLKFFPACGRMLRCRPQYITCGLL